MQVLSFFLFFLFLFLLIKSWFLKFWKNGFFRFSFHPEAIVFNEFCTSPVGVPAFWESSFHSWLSVKLKRQMAQSVLQSQQCVSLKLCSDGSTHVKSPAQDTDPCVGSCIHTAGTHPSFSGRKLSYKHLLVGAVLPPKICSHPVLLHSALKCLVVTGSAPRNQEPGTRWWLYFSLCLLEMDMRFSPSFHPSLPPSFLPWNKSYKKNP